MIYASLYNNTFILPDFQDKITYISRLNFYNLVENGDLTMSEKPRTEVVALLDEHERAMGYLIEMLERWGETDLNKVLPHDPETSYREILCHIVGSAYYGYFVWIQDVLEWDILPPPVEKDQVKGDHSLQRLIELLKESTPYARKALDSLTNDHLYPKIYNAYWGDPYTIDQMLEHAIVHVWRHIRQLERAERLEVSSEDGNR